MGSRKETPDILGELLGGSKSFPSDPAAETLDPTKEHENRLNKDKETDADIEYGESLLARAASTLKAASQVLDQQRMLEWFAETQRSFGREDFEEGVRPQGSSLENRVVEWAERHLGAKSTSIGYLANGLTAKRRYNVDVWAHLKGDPFRPDLDLWIDCREENRPVTNKDVSEFVKKATDVFLAAHTDKQDFWFDRLMFISISPFSREVLELAEDYGVICVLYDRTSFLIQTDPYWKLKPRWLREAEALPH